MKRGLSQEKKLNNKNKISQSPTLPLSKSLNPDKSSNGYGPDIIDKILQYKLGNGNNIYYKVNDISKLTGLSRQQIHNYTQLGLIKESYRTNTGHRFYSKETIDRIFLIEMLKRHRTLNEVKEFLQNKIISGSSQSPSTAISKSSNS